MTPAGAQWLSELDTWLRKQGHDLNGCGGRKFFWSKRFIVNNKFYWICFIVNNKGLVHLHREVRKTNMVSCILNEQLTEGQTRSCLVGCIQKSDNDQNLLLDVNLWIKTNSLTWRNICFWVWLLFHFEIKKLWPKPAIFVTLVLLLSHLPSQLIFLIFIWNYFQNGSKYAK